MLAANGNCRKFVTYVVVNARSLACVLCVTASMSSAIQYFARGSLLHACWELPGALTCMILDRLCLCISASVQSAGWWAINLPERSREAAGSSGVCSGLWWFHMLQAGRHFCSANSGRGTGVDEVCQSTSLRHKGASNNQNDVHCCLVCLVHEASIKLQC